MGRTPPPAALRDKLPPPAGGGQTVGMARRILGIDSDCHEISRHNGLLAAAPSFHAAAGGYIMDSEPPMSNGTPQTP